MIGFDIYRHAVFLLCLFPLLIIHFDIRYPPRSRTAMFIILGFLVLSCSAFALTVILDWPIYDLTCT